MDKENYCLVLGGGGAKGAYQVGAWKAFRELNIHFNAVIGASVGALNGALIVQNSFHEAVELWENISINKVIAIPDELVIDGKFTVNRNNFNVLRKLQRQILKGGGVDTTPLKKIISKMIDETGIRESKIDFGIVTYELSNLKPIEIFADKIENGLIIDYLMGSSTLPGFKATQINGKIYYDGGLYDNVPFALAKERGYKNIIVVDVSGLGVNKKPEVEGCRVTYIRNSFDLGNILDFNNAIARKNIELGYLDTMKIFGKIDGINYFYNIDMKILKELEKLLFSNDLIDNIRDYFDEKYLSINNLEEKIREILPKEISKQREIIISLLESSARLLNIEPVHYYQFNELIAIIYKEFIKIKENNNMRKGNAGDFDDFFQKVKKLNFFDFFNDKGKYNLVLNVFFDKNYIHYMKRLNGLFNNLLIPSAIFYYILERYYGHIYL